MAFWALLHPDLCLLLILSSRLVSTGEKLGKECVKEIMRTAPLIDGHNDLALQLRRYFNNNLTAVDLNTLTKTRTNLNKLKEGNVGAQLWSAYVLCSSQNKDAVRLTMEQIDVIKRMCRKYPEFEFVTSSKALNNTEKIACLISIEGGHSIDSSLAALRMFYELGVRSMSLTHNCHTPWAKSAVISRSNIYDINTSLTQFGQEVVFEMNRLGMIIDLSHTATDTAEVVLRISKAPVIFSHSSAYAICKHPRNVPDKLLHLIREKEGLVMVNFYPGFVACQEWANISQVAGTGFVQIYLDKEVVLCTSSSLPFRCALLKNLFPLEGIHVLMSRYSAKLTMTPFDEIIFYVPINKMFWTYQQLRSVEKSCAWISGWHWCSSSCC